METKEDMLVVGTQVEGGGEVSTMASDFFFSFKLKSEGNRVTMYYENSGKTRIGNRACFRTF